MTLLEAKEFIRNKYFADCKIKEDCQNVIGQYSLDCFGEKNSKKCISELQKIQLKYAIRYPTPTPDAMNGIFNEFAKFVEKKKLAIKPDFNATTFVIMTIVAAELEAELPDVLPKEE